MFSLCKYSVQASKSSFLRNANLNLHFSHRQKKFRDESMNKLVKLCPGQDLATTGCPKIHGH